MRAELTEALWLDQDGSVTLLELAEYSGLAEAEVSELIELGVFSPEEHPPEGVRFGAQCLVTARLACRLRDDLELDSHGVALMLDLLERVRELEAEVQTLRASLPRMRRT